MRCWGRYALNWCWPLHVVCCWYFDQRLDAMIIEMERIANKSTVNWVWLSKYCLVCIRPDIDWNVIYQMSNSVILIARFPSCVYMIRLGPPVYISIVIGSHVTNKIRSLLVKTPKTLTFSINNWSDISIGAIFAYANPMKAQSTYNHYTVTESVTLETAMQQP